MLSARSIFREIVDNDESFRLFASIAAAGEAQGGWENGRIAALLPDELQWLAPKVARHGKDEDKHGRIFNGLLRKRRLTPMDVPYDVNYTALLEAQGIGVTHAQLQRDERLAEHDVIVYLAHSRVTEQRASEQMALLRKHFDDDPLLGRAIRQIAADEANHLAYCNEELLRLNDLGHAAAVRRELRMCAHAEIRVYRDVSLGVIKRMGHILSWSLPKRVVLELGVYAVYGYERLLGWRRMVSLHMPQQHDALFATTAPANISAH